MKRVHVLYSGQVQGVGFRYSVQDIAMNLGVTGWVKNLEDRRVEVVAEGEQKDLEGFLDKIRTCRFDSMDFHVDNVCLIQSTIGRFGPVYKVIHKSYLK